MPRQVYLMKAGRPEAIAAGAEPVRIVDQPGEGVETVRVVWTRAGVDVILAVTDDLQARPVYIENPQDLVVSVKLTRQRFLADEVIRPATSLEEADEPYTYLAASKGYRVKSIYILPATSPTIAKKVYILDAEGRPITGS